MDENPSTPLIVHKLNIEYVNGVVGDGVKVGVIDGVGWWYQLEEVG